MRTLQMVMRLGAASLIATLAACSGGATQNASLPPVSSAPAMPAAAAHATATFTIAIPQATSTTSKLRSALFVSPNAKSIKIETLNPDGTTPVPAVTPTIAALSASAAGCQSTASGISCSISTATLSGTHQFRLSVYASTDATGSALAIGSVTTTIVAGTANAVAVTLGGVIATLAFATARLSAPADGATHQLMLTLSAKDASGALIIAPGDFYAGVTLAKSNDPNNALTIGSAGVTTPATNGLNTVTVAYDASKTLVDGTITASTANVPNATADITPLVYSLQSGTLVAGSATPALTLTVSEALTAGPFTATASPATAVTFTGSGTAASNGANAVFTLTGGTTGGAATVTIGDGSTSGTLAVNVTGSNVGVTVPAQPTVTEFSVLNGNAGANDITTGSNGDLWFAETTSGDIGEITTAGTLLHEYPVSAGFFPTRITSGPDGALWFTEFDAMHNSKIGRIGTNGTLTEFAVPTLAAHVVGITTGPDGALWFAEEDANKIGRITTAGVVTEFTGATSPRDLTAGPDGALWFTEFNYRVNPAPRKIGRITTAGALSEFPVNTAMPTSPAAEQPASITIGADGALWFTEYDPTGATTTNDIGRMTTAGAVTLYTAGLSAGMAPDGIKLLRDGNVWFTEGNASNTIGRIARITPLGTVAEFGRGITQNSVPAGLTSGPDGNIWFTEYATAAIGRLSF